MKKAEAFKYLENEFNEAIKKGDVVFDELDLLKDQQSVDDFFYQCQQELKRRGVDPLMGEK